MNKQILSAIDASLMPSPQRPINHHLIGPQRRRCLRLIAQADRFNRHHLGDEDTISLYDLLYPQGPTARPTSSLRSPRLQSVDVARLLEELEHYEMYRMVDALTLRMERHMQMLACILSMYRYR